jgi:hypothetical protein
MANEILVKEKTVITYDSTTTPALTLTSLSSGAGRVGAIKDLGAAIYPRRYVWRLKTQFDSAPIEGRTVEVYLAYSNTAASGVTTIQDGFVGFTDMALPSANQRYHCQLIGHAYCRNITGPQHSSGIFEIRSRYFSPVIYNDTDQAMSATASTHQLTFTPLAEELQ